MNILQSLLPEALQHFHFIRPYWLLMIVPAFLMSALLLHREKNSNAWQRHIDPALLEPLLQGKVNTPGKKLPILSLLFWGLCSLALAGPSWEKLPTPVEKHDNALVILMDLSPSMLAGDVKPSRLVAARHKILDLLQQRKEGYTALIGYSGDAHVVSPLTDDTQTIANLLNVLEPGIMPVYGSNLEDALGLALQLFQNGGYTKGNILLVSDGITKQALENSVSILNGKTFTLSIIGVGTEEGGPIPDSNGGFVKNKHGTILLPQLDADQLIALAKGVNGYYSSLQLNDNDIQPLIDGTLIFSQGKTKKVEREFDQWRDIGGYLCLALLPLLLAGFRRGVLISVMMALPLFHIPAAEASTPEQTGWHLPLWENLWLNDNQRAMKAMKEKDYEKAAKQFRDPNWKAAAQYEQGDYSSALKQFQNDASEKGLYNQANALAKSGQLQEAINAYKDALKQNPQFDDAAFNKNIVEQLLEQQQKQPQNQNQQDQDGDKSQQEQSKDGQQDNQNGSQPQDKNESQQQNSDSSGQNNQNQGEQQKAHEEQDKNKSDAEAQQQKADTGKTQSDPSPENQKKEDEQQGKAEKPKGEDSTGTESKLTPEQKQALEQWLRQVPDDPSGLLRNKFEYYYQQRLQEQQTGKPTKHTNNEERW